MSVEAVLIALAEYLGKKVLTLVAKPDATTRQMRSQADRVETAIATHLRKVANWSAQYKFSRMSLPKEVDADTVALMFSSEPRQFRFNSPHSSDIAESEILKMGSHIMLLGPPGAGKTTTLKRICRPYFVDLDVETPEEVRFPLLIRLKSLSEVSGFIHPLLAQIATELGLHVYTKSLEIPGEDEESSTQGLYAQGKQPRSFDESADDREIADYARARKARVRYKQQDYCEQDPLETKLIEILNETGPLLIIDGLDEVGLGARMRVERDIQLLVENAAGFRLVVSCRTGENTLQTEGIAELNVRPLTSAQITAISKKWLKKRTSQFISELYATPLSQLADRPLFLAQILNVYLVNRYIPAKPTDVYQLLVTLLLEEWDRQRDVARASVYAAFDPQKKLRFLFALAYEFTYKARATEFGLSDLMSVYDAIHKQFDLPKEQAREVARELQSHTGIIEETGFDKYEFSHLVIQEYLTAEFLVRSPIPETQIPKLLEHAPAPLAVATSLSTNPPAWLKTILTNTLVLDNLQAQPLLAYLDRLGQEQPRFEESNSVGSCLLFLLFRAEKLLNPVHRERANTTISRLLQRASTRNALKACLANYKFTHAGQHDRYLTAKRFDGMDRTGDSHDVELISLPFIGSVQRDWLEAEFPDIKSEIDPSLRRH